MSVKQTLTTDDVKDKSQGRERQIKSHLCESEQTNARSNVLQPVCRDLEGKKYRLKVADLRQRNTIESAHSVDSQSVSKEAHHSTESRTTQSKQYWNKVRTSIRRNNLDDPTFIFDFYGDRIVTKRRIESLSADNDIDTETNIPRFFIFP